MRRARTCGVVRNPSFIVDRRSFWSPVVVRRRRRPLFVVRRSIHIQFVSRDSSYSPRSRGCGLRRSRPRQPRGIADHSAISAPMAHACAGSCPASSGALDPQTGLPRLTAQAIACPDGSAAGLDAINCGMASKPNTCGRGWLRAGQRAHMSSRAALQSRRGRPRGRLQNTPVARMVLLAEKLVTGSGGAGRSNASVI